MKIFVQSIFKCKKCPFNTTTSLKANEYKEIESDYKISLVEKFLTSQEGQDFLKKLQPQFDFITDTDISECLISENIRKLLFEIDVVDGQLNCDNCGLIYPIKDSILDTVDCIEPKIN